MDVDKDNERHRREEQERRAKRKVRAHVMLCDVCSTMFF